MPIRNFKPFKFPEANQPGRRDVQALQAALKKLRIPVAEQEIRRGELGGATKDAIKEFQRRAKLRVDGVIGPKTVAGLQAEMAHAFFAHTKTRTANRHDKLQRFGYKLDADEEKGRSRTPGLAYTVDTMGPPKCRRPPPRARGLRASDRPSS